MNKLEIARNMMLLAHKGQKRWDGRDYSVHPVKVVELLQLFGIDNDDILAVGYLHDTLEDTDLSPQLIKDVFGVEVLALIEELTNKENPTDEEYAIKCKNLTYGAKMVKICDILANITDDGKKSDHFIKRRLAGLKAMINP